MNQIVGSWCERLVSSPAPPSLDHNDLHPWNILGDPGHPKYYDWGDSVVAHPFAAARLPLLFVQRDLDAGLDDPRFLRARDAYLDVFADLAPRRELVEALALACHVAKIARALTWDRALRAARDQDEPVEDDWVTAPRETLTSLLDESYLAGG
jgi:aminoglycoside phosphotransferase (APT) family kinase protein